MQEKSLHLWLKDNLPLYLINVNPRSQFLAAIASTVSAHLMA